MKKLERSPQRRQTQITPRIYIAGMRLITTWEDEEEGKNETTRCDVVSAHVLVEEIARREVSRTNITHVFFVQITPLLGGKSVRL
jgi:hypothetical protein